MKKRNGFVSNSSSTSFIVVLNERNEPCPHCGRKDVDFVDLIERASGSYCDDTHLNWSDPQQYLDEIEEEIETEEKYLRELMLKDPSEGLSYGDYTVADQIKWTKDNLQQLAERYSCIQKLVESGKRLIGFSISYHDNALNELVRMQVENGTMELINEVD